MIFNVNYKSLVNFLPLVAGLLLGIGALTGRTLADAYDLEIIIKRYTPKELINDNKFEHIYKTIIDRPIYLNPDGLYWIVYATELIKKKAFRIRLNEHDNAPFGREIGWSSSYLWYLVLLGKIDSILTDRELISGIEHAGRWANPLLVGIFGAFWGIMVGLRFNPIVGGMIPLMLYYCGAIQHDITYGFGDHHALHFSLAISQLLAIILGGAGFYQNNKKYQSDVFFTPLNPPDLTSAKKWFIAAGFFGAAGLWVGANQQSLIIALIGYGGCLSALLCNQKKGPFLSNSSTLSPELWRIWGWSGAIFCCLFYFIEFFPHQLGFRLEIIHPLYALSWIGGSEILYRVCRLSAQEQKNEILLTDKITFLLSILALLSLPIAVMFGPKSWHIVHDSITVRWHDTIYEYMSVLDPLVGKISFDFIFDRFGFYILFIPLTIIAFTRRSLNNFQQAAVTQSAISAIILLSLYIYEVRWAIPFSAALIVLSITLFSYIIDATQRMHYFFKKSILVIFLIVTSAQFLYFNYERYFSDDQTTSINKRFFTLSVMLLGRDMAINFVLNSKNDPIRLLGAGELAPIFAYYGVAQSIGSPYWENHEGIKDDSKFFSAYSDAEAIEVAMRRKATHALFEVNDFKMASEALWTNRGSSDTRDLKRTLAYRIASHPNSVQWLTPEPMYVSFFTDKYNLVSYKINLSSSTSPDSPNDQYHF